MGDFLLTIGFVLLFAWVARGLVGARELTWRRTLLAIFVGVVFGMAVAILLLVRDFAQDQEIEGGQIFALSLPFALIGTMGAIVVLELLFAQPRARRGLHVPHPFKALHRRAGIIRRGWQVTRIIARNGLAPLVGLRRGEVSTRSPEEVARRAALPSRNRGECSSSWASSWRRDRISSLQPRWQS
jgi:hypothetical protein